MLFSTYADLFLPHDGKAPAQRPDHVFPKLHHVARRTFNRAGFKLLVTVNALRVKRIAPGNHFGVFDFTGVVAIQADLVGGIVGRLRRMAVTAGPQGRFILLRVVMAFITGDADACF
jgi:hypothetical protein